jgi:hypothetical protein
VGGAALLLFALGLYFPGENFLLIDPVSISVLPECPRPSAKGGLAARTTPNQPQCARKGR